MRVASNLQGRALTDALAAIRELQADKVQLQTRVLQLETRRRASTAVAPVSIDHCGVTGDGLKKCVVGVPACVIVTIRDAEQQPVRDLPIAAVSLSCNDQPWPASDVSVQPEVRLILHQDGKLI